MRIAVSRIQHSSHVDDGRHFILFVFQMSRLSYYSEVVLNELIKVTNNSEMLRTARTENEIVMKAAPEIFSTICGHSVSNKIKGTDHKKILAPNANAIALKKIVLLDSQLDHIFPNYLGERLNGDIKRKIKKINAGRGVQNLRD